MAQHLEPMDVDDIYEDKENASINVLPVPENVEELDASEFNMKLRYSLTPNSSPMSKSYTVADKAQDVTKSNLTQSHNFSTIGKSDSTSIAPKPLALKTLSLEDDSNKTINVLRQLDSLIDEADVTVTVTNADVDEDGSIPSTSSATPEAVTPTSEAPKPAGSPILRGIQHVLNMFRAPSPIQQNEELETEAGAKNTNDDIESTSLTASTPLITHKTSDSIANRENKDTVFNDELQKELQWEETTIIFSKEKFPIHKLLFQNETKSIASPNISTVCDVSMADDCEPMEISYNDSVVKNKTLKLNETANKSGVNQGVNSTTLEKDTSVFLDCETTFNESEVKNAEQSLNTNKTAENKTNDTSFMSMHSAETLACTSDVSHNVASNETYNNDVETENAVTSSTFVTEVLNAPEAEDFKAVDLTIIVENDAVVSKMTENQNDLTVEQKLKLESESTVTNDPVIAEVASVVVEEMNAIDAISNEKMPEKSESCSQLPIEIQNEIISEIEVTSSTNTAESETIVTSDQVITVSVADAIDSTIIEKENEVLLDKSEAENTEKSYVCETIQTNEVKAVIDIINSNEKNCSDICQEKDNVIKEESENVEIFSSTQDHKSIESITDKASNVQVQINNDLSQVVDVAAGLSTKESCKDSNIDEKMDKLTIENIESAIIPAIVDITLDGSLIITRDKESLEILTENEDLSTVNADFLVPDDDNEQEEGLESVSANIKEDIEITSTVMPNPTTVIEDKPTKDEEIVVSESTSPYVSLLPEKVEEKHSNDETVITSQSPSLSPPIKSAGYNFNFDEIENPFATRTKLSMSPTRQLVSNSINTSFNTSQTIKPKALKTPGKTPKKMKGNAKTPVKLNKTFDGQGNIRNSTSKPEKPTVIEALRGDLANTLNTTIDKLGNVSNVNTSQTFESIEETMATANNVTFNKTQDLELHLDSPKSQESHVLKDFNDINIIDMSKEIKTDSKEIKTKVSSSELAVETPQADKEPEPINTNSFSKSTTETSKSTSPPSDQSEFHSLTSSSNNHVADKNNVCMTQANDLIHERESLNNTFPITQQKLPSQSTNEITDNNSNTQDDDDIHDVSAASEDRDVTVREVHTEDEDTAEGPFIESHLKKDDAFTDFESIKTDDILPCIEKEEIFESAEMFIDADAFDFLMNQNKSNEVISSGKESLFLKFDPLFAKRVNSDGMLDVLAKVQKRQSTPKKFKPHMSIMDMSVEEKPGPSYENNATFDTETNFDETVNLSNKPTMVVTPVVPKPHHSAQSRSARRSMAHMSPAMAVIDRLLTISANNSMNQDDTVVNYNTDQEEAERALAELRDLVASKELEVYSMKNESKDLKDRLFNLELQMESLERESQRRLKAINELNEALNEKEKTNKNMEAVVEEYEKTIAGLIAEIESDKKRNAEEKIELIKDRDEQTAHLANMEGAFSDLHSKYEKSKQIIYTYKANEEAYKKSIEKFETSLIKMEENYDALKQHATAQLDHANTELEKINKSHESEVVKLRAMIKRKDLHITSLEENLAQKIKANEELTSICDELISKVG